MVLLLSTRCLYGGYICILKMSSWPDAWLYMSSWPYVVICTFAQLFNLYCSTLHEVVISPDENEKPLSLYGFADDHTVCNQFKANDRSAELESITKLWECASNLKSWMDLNRLQMNNAKMEFILYGSQPQLDKCITDEILIVDSIIKRSDIVQQLGAFLDKNLNFKHHITTKCSNAMTSIFKIKNIRKYLTQSATKILVLSTVVSHLNYCNSILAGLPNSEISQMQRGQNIAAKLVLGKSKFHSSSECLWELHWLPINKQIQFKVLTLVFKCLDYAGPLYQRNLLVRFPEDRKQGLRSDNMVKRLLEPRSKLKTFALRAFSVISLRWWNQLPSHVKSCDNLTDFKKSLKTYLFINDLN